MGVGRVANNSSPKKYNVSKKSKIKPRTCNDPLAQAKERKRDMRFDTWNVKNLYRAGSHTATSRESSRYKLDLVGVQEVRRDKGGTIRAADCHSF